MKSSIAVVLLIAALLAVPSTSLLTAGVGRVRPLMTPLFGGGLGLGGLGSTGLYRNRIRRPYIGTGYGTGYGGLGYGTGLGTGIVNGGVYSDSYSDLDVDGDVMMGDDIGGGVVIG